MASKLGNYDLGTLVLGKDVLKAPPGLWFLGSILLMEKGAGNPYYYHDTIVTTIVYIIYYIVFLGTILGHILGS